MAHADRKVARSYDHLHHHIKIKHPNLLEAYECGWQALSPHLRSKFLGGLQGPVNDYYHSLIEPVGRMPQGWMSWSNFAYANMQLPKCDWTNVRKFVTDEIDHAGLLFGIPPSPEPFRYAKRLYPIGQVYDETVAEKVVTGCMYHVEVEVRNQVLKKLEKDGLKSLTGIFGAKSVLKKLFEEE
jgi:hypothetical protein